MRFQTIRLVGAVGIELFAQTKRLVESIALTRRPTLKYPRKFRVLAPSWPHAPGVKPSTETVSDGHSCRLLDVPCISYQQMGSGEGDGVKRCASNCCRCRNHEEFETRPVHVHKDRKRAGLNTALGPVAVRYASE